MPRLGRPCGRRRREREVHHELAFLAEARARRRDAPAVQLDEPADDRRAEPEAAARAVERRVALHEDVEHVREQIRIEPRAGVADADHELVTPPGGVYFLAESERRPDDEREDGVVKRIAGEIGHRRLAGPGRRPERCGRAHTRMTGAATRSPSASPTHHVPQTVGAAAHGCTSPRQRLATPIVALTIV
jgi:hypothetical protein